MNPRHRWMPRPRPKSPRFSPALPTASAGLLWWSHTTLAGHNSPPGQWYSTTAVSQKTGVEFNDQTYPSDLARRERPFAADDRGLHVSDAVECIGEPRGE